MNIRNFLKVSSLLVLTVFFIVNPGSLKAQSDSGEEDSQLLQLDKLKTTTSSLVARKAADAPSNIMVITRDIIERRGYQNLVEICQDIPGFDFATYEDGGGEFPAHNFNRGIGGDAGNAKILIMVDGVVQNFINFGWSTLWTNEHMLIDVDRIEIVQGPGSVLYGSNAYSGVIHIITRKKHQGLDAKAWYGQHNSMALDFHYGTVFKGADLSVAFRKFKSDGDGGDRYDPGNFFHNITAPNTLDRHYTANGQYLTGVPNPNAGQTVPDGFNTEKNDTSLRLKFAKENLQMGFFYWNREDGLGSYDVGYEYYANDPDKLYKVHTRGLNFFAQYRATLTDRLLLQSNLVYRTLTQMPETGFEYTYKFIDMPKTYSSFSSQGYIEEQLQFKLNPKHHFIAGFRLMSSLKSSQLISLNAIQDQHSNTTTSSYAIANSGGGLGKLESVSALNSIEYAGYLLWDGNISDRLDVSAGVRYDHSSEYGSTVNPRLALIYKAIADKWSMKFLFGTAFRQPSIFELADEWRKNPDLEPEKIQTFEIENYFWLTRRMNVRVNLFFSVLSDFIKTVPAADRPGGLMYDNVGKSWVKGFSLFGQAEPAFNLYLYANYIYTDGKEEGGDWGQIDNTAKHKFNAGFNWLLLNDLLNIHCRLNFVGKRKAPESNTWLKNHENGFAPAYKKVDLVLTLNRLFGSIDLKPQLIIKNLFDEEFYGVGRQAGSGDRDQWNPVSNPNPPGFIPAYHPQPGITFMFNLRLTL